MPRVCPTIWRAGWPPRRPAIASPAAPPVAPPAADTPLHYASIAEVAEQLRAGRISPVELAEATLERIAQRDPALSAFQLVLAERARASALRAEREIAAGEYRGPLHGIPIAVKDLLDLAGAPTTAGSKILAGRVRRRGLQRRRAPGRGWRGDRRQDPALEFAYSPGSNNGHYGPTHNPWDGTRDTGGSSSGSAAAVAAGLAYAALGSDTGGSIRIPASLCGVVGLKPTFGRISLHGAVPLAWSLDHLGPLTRSVGDAALLLAALAGADPRDQRSYGSQPFAAPDPGASVAGLRIGVLGDDGSGAALGTDAALAAWRAGLAAAERAGAELVPIDAPELNSLLWLNNATLAMEAAAYHLPWLRERLGDYGEFMR